jgi:hypothetical protein
MDVLLLTDKDCLWQNFKQPLLQLLLDFFVVVSNKISVSRLLVDTVFTPVCMEHDFAAGADCIRYLTQ